jgi:hypothetical protein
MMTVNEVKIAIGQRVQVRFESILVECTVVDARQAYGKWRFVVEPVSGSGRQNVELDRIKALPAVLAKAGV